MNVCVNNTGSGVSGDQRATAHHAHLHLGHRYNEINSPETDRNFSVRETRRKYAAGDFICNTANVKISVALNYDLQANLVFNHRTE